ncbi:DUF808 family protein [Vibrio lentus]|nr:DUF808 family protein [Vibrio lentus]
MVWAVAKGSFKNKLDFGSGGIIDQCVHPLLIMPLLVIGGLFLCFEGAEKILEKLFSSALINMTRRKRGYEYWRIHRGI